MSMDETAAPRYTTVEAFLTAYQRRYPAERSRFFGPGADTPEDAVLVFGTEYLDLDGDALIGRAWQDHEQRYTWSFAFIRADGDVDRVIRWGASSEREARALLAAYRDDRVRFALVAEDTTEEFDWDPWAPGRVPHDLWLSILGGDLYPTIDQALEASLTAAEARGRPIIEVPVVVPADLMALLDADPDR
jgi:hypothetical protein